MPKMSLDVSDKTKEKLEKLATKEECSMSMVIRRAISIYNGLILGEYKLVSKDGTPIVLLENND